jgi:HEPN domain-containing protein
MNRPTAQWILKAEEDWDVARDLAARKPPPRNAVCFHCQQAAEKYLKALLQESGAAVPRTHELEDVLDLLLPFDSTLAPLRRGLHSLSRYAVEYRYPGPRATTKQMETALRKVERIRSEVRQRLGLPI